MSTFKRIAVYCGSSGRVAPVYLETARKVGQSLAERGVTVVYGGGRVGTMGAVAEGALAHGGKVIGVIPKRLQALEVGHEGLTELHVVDGMSARKNLMIELSDAFIALPGGFGTLEEFAETTSLAVLNYNEKPTALLNLDGFYDHFISFLDHATATGFIRPLQRNALVSAENIEDLLDALDSARISKVDEWLKESQ